MKCPVHEWKHAEHAISRILAVEVTGDAEVLCKVTASAHFIDNYIEYNGAESLFHTSRVAEMFSSVDLGSRRSSLIRVFRSWKATRVVREMWLIRLPGSSSLIVSKCLKPRPALLDVAQPMLSEQWRSGR